MDSVPDTGLYSDIITDPSLNGTAFQPDIGVVADPTNVIPDIPGSDILSGAFSFVGSVADLIKSLTQDVGAAVTTVEKSDPLSWVTDFAGLVGKVGGITGRVMDLISGYAVKLNPDDIGGTIGQGNTAWQFLADHSLGFLYRGMLELGMEVDTSKFDADAQRGVNVIDTMLSFSFLLQFIGAVLESYGKAEFGGRWGEALSKSLMELPQELGLTWAMGMSIDEAFKTAVGRSVEEGINRQKRGERIGWPQLRTLLKQHVLDDSHFQTLMENQGFPDEQIELLKKLQDVQIPIGDIAQLWYRDVIDDARAKELIGELGFGTDQTEWLFSLYVKKSENSASVTYRTIARGMFVNHLITEDQYRFVLTNANYPKRLIDEDVAGILLEQNVGHVLNSVTTIKTRYQHHAIDAQEAQKELRELNYADTYITQLISTWNMLPLVKSHGLSQAKILSYYVSGTITRAQAMPQLLATGLDQVSTDFLLDHPTANAAVRIHQRTPSLVTQTYLDGALTLDQLPDAYRSAHVQDADIPWYVNDAKYRYSHMKGHGTPTKTLSDGDIRAAFKVGLLDFPHCVTMLQVNGWSSDDAMLLTEITNKGPYEAPGAPAFASLSAALDYLRLAGFVIHPPTDPMLLAAESMAGMAGYTWTPATDQVGSGIPPVTLP